MNPEFIARAVAGIAALFGGALVLHETKKTVDVVPKTVDALKGLYLPVTIIAAAFLIKAWKK